VGCKLNTKETLVKNIRFADGKADEAKKSYGDGISVKGIIANISTNYFLIRSNQKKQMGKDWDDSDVNLPSYSMGPLNASYFFDAKTDQAVMGTRGGVTYQVVDKDNFIQGYVAIAWENPYTGDFVYCVLVSKTDDLLDECLNHCYYNNSSKIGGHVTKQFKKINKNFITANAVDDNKSTAYLVVGIKTDDMVREVFGSLEGGGEIEKVNVSGGIGAAAAACNTSSRITDKEEALAALQKEEFDDEGIIQKISESLLNNKEFVLEALRHNRSVLKYASKALKVGGRYLHNKDQILHFYFTTRRSLSYSLTYH
jgi:hypothetical protein